MVISRDGRGARAFLVIVAVGVAAVLLAVGPSRAYSHPLHTTFTELRVEESQGIAVVEARVRLFADDLAAVAGKELAWTSSPTPAAVMAYLGRNLTLRRSSGGSALALSDCGFQRRGDALTLCLRATERVGGGTLIVRNTLFMERYVDEVNVVRFAAAGVSSTVLLTRASPERALR